MAVKPLTQKEEKEGKVERILPGNLLALRAIDDSPNSAIARLLEENRQLRKQTADRKAPAGSPAAIDYERIGQVLDERLKLPFDVLAGKSSNAEEIGNILEARLNKILEPFMEK
jgi:hypothetical protein